MFFVLHWSKYETFQKLSTYKCVNKKAILGEKGWGWGLFLYPEIPPWIREIILTNQHFLAKKPLSVEIPGELSSDMN